MSEHDNLLKEFIDDDDHVVPGTTIVSGPKVALSQASLELSDAMVENFKQNYLEAVRRAKELEEGHAIVVGLTSNAVRAHGCRFGVKITIEIGKIKQEFNA